MNTRFLFTLAAALGALMPLIFDAALKGGVLLAAAACAALALWRASAAARHLVWLVAVAALLVVPVLTVVLPQWRVLPGWAVSPLAAAPELPLPERPQSPPAHVTPAPPLPAAPSAPAIEPSSAVTSPVTDTAAAAPVASTASVAAPAVKPFDWRDWLPLAWAAGFALLALRLLAAHLLLRRAARSCTALAAPPDGFIAAAFDVSRRHLGIRQHVTLLLDEKRTIPVVWGVFRPRLVLPAEAREWNEEQLRSVLLHELAHIKRRDALVQWLTQIACALHWFNPLVWLAAWRLHAERERACDDLVLASGVRPSAYAEHLLHVATRLSPARWTAACGLAMARKSSLEGRLLAVLSEKLNRRGLTRALTAAALLLAAAVAIPIAMLRAADEKTEAKAGAKLQPDTAAKLQWGEPVNGLRMALAWPPVFDDALLGKDAYFKLVVQNVSEKDVRFTAGADAPNPRSMRYREGERIVQSLSDPDAQKADWQLKPGECGVLRLFSKEERNKDGKTMSALIEGDLSKLDRYHAIALMEIAKAPAGAWTGKLVTGETRGSADIASAPKPKHKEARALYEIWQRHARTNGDIPGALIGELATGMRRFITYNPTWGTVPALNAILTRLDATRDWKSADAIALLDEVAAVKDSPLDMTLSDENDRVIVPGQPLPKELADKPWIWSQADASGLRIGWDLEPRGQPAQMTSKEENWISRLAPGTALGARLFIHNTGRQSVIVRVPTWHQGGVSAVNRDAEEIEVHGIDWTTLASLVTHRLAPGEYVAIRAPGVGFAKDAGRGPWAGPRVGWNLEAKPGDWVRLTHAPLACDASHVGRREVDPIEDGPAWWTEFVKARLARGLTAPGEKSDAITLPAPADRALLLDRACRDLFGTDPTAAERTAFDAVKSRATLFIFAEKLAQRPGITSFDGTLTPPHAWFEIQKPDPATAERPRVVLGPGEYPLSAMATLKIVGKPVGNRRTNDAEIRFADPEPEAARPAPPHKLEVPDGWGTWAIVCRPSDGFFYLLHKGGARKIEYSNPAKVTDIPATDLPDEFRDEVKRQFDIHEVSAESQAEVFEKPAPPADTPAPKASDASPPVVPAPGPVQPINDGKSSAQVLRAGGQEPVVIITGRALTASPDSTNREGSVTMEVATSDKTITIRYTWPEEAPGFLDLKTGGYPVSRFDLSRGRLFFVHFEKLEFSADVFQVPAAVKVPVITSPETLTQAAAAVTAWYAASDDRARWEFSRVVVPDNEYKAGQPLDVAADKIVWGEANDVGLRLGLGGLEPGASFPVGQQLPVKQYIRNDSTKTITFSPTQIFNEGVGGELVRTADGKKFPHKKGYPWQGFFHRVRLAPSHYIELGSGPMRTIMAEKDGSSAGGMDMMAHGFTVLPGEYTLQVTHDIGQFLGRPVNFHFGDPRGVPGLGEWTGVLKSAAVPLRLVDQEVKTAKPGESAQFGDRYMLAFDKGVIRLRHYLGYPNMRLVGGPWEDHSRDWKVPAADGEYVAAWAVGGKGVWVKDASGITHLIVKENLTETGKWTLSQASGGLGGMPAGVRAALQLPPALASQPFDFKKLPATPGAAKIDGGFFEMTIAPDTVLGVPHSGGGFFVESGGSVYGPAEGNPVIELGLTDLLRAKLAETPNTAGLEMLRHMIADGRGAIRDCAFRLLDGLKAPQAPFDYDAVFHAMIRASIEDEEGPKELTPEAHQGYTWLHNLFHTTRGEWERTRPLLAAGKYQPGEAPGADTAIVWTLGSDGLSLGVSGLPAGTNLEIGKSVPVTVYLRNDSTAPVKLSVPTEHNPVIQISLTDAAGKTHRAIYPFSAPLTGYNHHELAPGTGAKVAAFDLEACATTEEANRAEHKEGKAHNPRLAVPAGPYKLHLEYRNYQENPVLKGAASEWTGKVSAKPVPMKIAVTTAKHAPPLDDPALELPAGGKPAVGTLKPGTSEKLSWGGIDNGLRAALVPVPPSDKSVADGKVMDLNLVLQNVSSAPIRLRAGSPFPGTTVHFADPDGKELTSDMRIAEVLSTVEERTLQPDEVAVFGLLSVVLGTSNLQEKSIHGRAVGQRVQPPGEGWQMWCEAGLSKVPQGFWQGQLKTGVVKQSDPADILTARRTAAGEFVLGGEQLTEDRFLERVRQHKEARGHRATVVILTPKRIDMKDAFGIAGKLSQAGIVFSRVRPEDEPVKLKEAAAPAEETPKTGDTGQRRKLDWSKFPHYNAPEIPFANPFVPGDALRLAAAPNRSKEDTRRLLDMIHQATAEKAVELRPLVKDEALKASDDADGTIGFALAAYDYAVNDNKVALQQLVDAMAVEPNRRAETAAWSLVYVDEWELTDRAFNAHFGRFSVAEEHAMFWEVREFLHPESYARHFAKELTAAKLDAASLGGVWKGSKDGMSVELRLGEKNEWEITRGEKSLSKAELRTHSIPEHSRVELRTQNETKSDFPFTYAWLKPGGDGTLRLHLYRNGDQGRPSVTEVELTKQKGDPAAAVPPNPSRKVDWSKFPAYDEMDNPFDPAKAIALAAKPRKSNADTRRLMFLILQAAVEKAPELLPLLKDETLKKTDDEYHSIGLALSAYGYSLNGNKEALQFIFDELAKERRGSDAQAVVPLGFIDEWDLTMAAFEKHFAQGADGAAALAKMLFWDKRRYLFPENLARFHKERVAAAKLDAESLRGVWKGSKDGVSVELRLGDNQGWEVKQGDKLIKVDLTSYAWENGKAVSLMAPRASQGQVPCGRLWRGDDGKLRLSVWPDTSETTPYPRVNEIVLEKQADTAAKGVQPTPGLAAPLVSADQIVKGPVQDPKDPAKKLPASDPRTRTTTFSGNVRLRLPTMALDADEMDVVLKEGAVAQGEQAALSAFESITAKGRVRAMLVNEKSQASAAGGGHLHYDGKTGMLTLKDWPEMRVGNKLVTGRTAEAQFKLNLGDFPDPSVDLKDTLMVTQDRKLTAEDMPRTADKPVPPVNPETASRTDPERSIKTARFYEKRGNPAAAVIYYSEVMHDPASPHREEARKSIARLVTADPALGEKFAHLMVNNLEPGNEAQLDWGEAVNGLRGAVVVMYSAAAGGRQRIYLAVQNVSQAPLRFADTVKADELRKLYVSDSKGILFVLTNGEPTKTDVVLQPREVTYLSMMLQGDSTGEKSPTAALIEGLRKDSLQTWKAVLEIKTAPEGAWKGKLTTAETRGAISVNGPQPKDAKAQALFKLWQNSARLNGDIPGGLLNGLHDKVKEFIRNNSGDASGDPYAKKMAPLELRFGVAGDWKPQEVVALMDDIAAVTAIPLEVTREHLERNTLQHGQQLPAAYAKADWGEPLESGLRMAYVLEPRAAEYPLGTEVKARIILHNSGKEPVAFITRSFDQPGHKAKNAEGGDYQIDSTFWTTVGRPQAYRLAPGEYCEVNAPGLGIGARNNDRDDWSNVRAGSWILCEAGDEVTFLPGGTLLTPQESAEVDPDWWLSFITDRLNREAPVPLDRKEREYLLYRVVRELFATAPSTTEGDAFAADKSPDALKNLAVLLTKHAYGKQCHGMIHPGETKFRVLPPDPDAAKRPRVAMNPGRYNLGDLVRFVVTRRPQGQRIVNEASLIYFPQGKDNVIHKVELPDGYNTWAACWEPGTTVMWVSEKGLLRSFDFTDPAAVKETRYEGEKTDTAPLPVGIRKAITAALTVPDAPVQLPKQIQEPLSPVPAPAASPAADEGKRR
jgi:beta-lactamase regulating signal transducer with metallopeptidase domain